MTTVDALALLGGTLAGATVAAAWAVARAPWRRRAVFDVTYRVRVDTEWSRSEPAPVPMLSEAALTVLGRLRDRTGGWWLLDGDVEVAAAREVVGVIDLDVRWHPSGAIVVRLP
jgi:hypothetical protein